jgi:hypothetical protein
MLIHSQIFFSDFTSIFIPLKFRITRQDNLLSESYVCVYVSLSGGKNISNTTMRWCFFLVRSEPVTGGGGSPLYIYIYILLPSICNFVRLHKMKREAVCIKTIFTVCLLRHTPGLDKIVDIH